MYIMLYASCIIMSFCVSVVGIASNVATYLYWNIYNAVLIFK